MTALVYGTLFGSTAATVACAWNGLFWSTVALAAVAVATFIVGMLAPWEE